LKSLNDSRFTQKVPSNEEQKARLQARLDDPTKRWKFNPSDLAERKYWDD
jgi:polyphosphate kinase 2 (PPK2 family)